MENKCKSDSPETAYKCNFILVSTPKIARGNVHMKKTSQYARLCKSGFDALKWHCQKMTDLRAVTSRAFAFDTRFHLDLWFFGFFASGAACRWAYPLDIYLECLSPIMFVLHRILCESTTATSPQAFSALPNRAYYNPFKPINLQSKDSWNWSARRLCKGYRASSLRPACRA